jgi:hypothetical protein
MRPASSALPILMVSFAACSSWHPPTPAAPRTGTPVQASYGRVWEAAIDELADRNAPITQLYRESGYMNTDMVRVPATVRDTLAECWRIKRAFYADTLITPTNAYYNIVVRGDSSRSTVKVNTRWVHLAPGNMGPIVTACESRGVWERRTEEAIKARAEANR